MINRKLDQITLSDFENLIENEIPESKTLEYKRDLNIEKGEDRKEFLKDISSFSNAIGGDIIFGIEEDKKTNLPIKMYGIKIDNINDIVLQLESIIRDNISPRITLVDIKYFEIEEFKYIILIRIGKSYFAPHRITYRDYDKFFSRNSKGKFSMDVNDLRLAFNMSQNITEKIENYKSKRIQDIILNRYNILEKDSTLFVLHMIPISAFENNINYSVTDIENAMSKSKSNTFGSIGNRVYNFDGIFQYNNTNYHVRTDCKAYTQYYKNGIIETVTKNFFNPSFANSPLESKIKIIYFKQMLEKTINSVNCFFEYMKALDIITPIFLSVSLINILGYCIEENWFSKSNEIDRDILLIENVIIDDYSEKVENILKPIFDNIWNACGYSNCSAYDEDGNYI